MKIVRNLIKFTAWFILTTLSGLLLIITSASLYLSPSLPSVNSLRDVHLQTPLRIYSQDNKLIAEFGNKRRIPLRFNQIPPNMIHAFLSAEDDRFYSHIGVDPIALMRAAFQLVTTGHIRTGGSTITMQVAKNFFLSHKRIFSRKFNEILLSLQIERELSKNNILELYLNKIYLGNRAYGIGAAAQVYYDKSVKDLTIAQTAMIAGLPKAPSKYNPIDDPERAITRRNWILKRMLTLGYINKNQYNHAVSAPITASYHAIQIELQAPYIAEMARQQVIEKFGSLAYTEGFQIYTTIDSRLQKQANEAMTDGLINYSERHGYRGSINNLKNNPENKIKEWGHLVNRKETQGILEPAIVISVEAQQVTILLKNHKIKTINWDNLKWARKYITVNRIGLLPKTATDILQIGDLIWVRQLQNGSYRLSQKPKAQGALVSINPNDGSILSLVGGFNFYSSMYNRATQSIRQAGSAFKPFIYSAALAHGMTAATIINDAPIVFNSSDMANAWRPNNDNLLFNGPMTLRMGLYRSRNLVSIRVLRQTGIKNTINFISHLGLARSSMAADLSLALGNVAISPIILTKIYAVLANGGYEITPFLIKRIMQDNKIIFKENPATVCQNCSKQPKNKVQNQEEIMTHAETPSTALLAKRVLNPQIDYIMDDILQDVIRKGTGRRARTLKRNDIAGKTGTTNDNKDTWFVGFNPDILTTIWVGMDDHSSLGKRDYGANTALPIWIQYMQYALAGMPEKKAVRPHGLISLKINPKTGNLAHSNTKNAIFELFRKKYAPQFYDNKITVPNTQNTDNTMLSPENIF